MRVYAVNDGPDTDVEVRYGLCALGGGFPLDQRRALRLPSNASTLVAEIDERRWNDLGDQGHAAFAILSAAGREVARDTLFRPLYRDIQWPEARVSVRRDADPASPRAVFSSDSFAWRVCVDLDGEKAYPDNFFDLLPGVPYVVEWPQGLGEPRVLGVGNDAMRRHVKKN